MTELIYAKCDWCEATFEGTAEDLAEAGWFRLEHSDVDDLLDFDSMDCLISWLPSQG